jgi:hypothetical protein
MLKLQKSHLTCSYCSKIFKDPIELLCNHSICREHLKEKDVVKHNRIKCNKCSEEFGVRDNQFKSNNELNKLIESHSYLNKEELSLKKELEESIWKFYQIYDEFHQKKTKLDLDVFDHFQEIRFQIDETREKIKERIDVIALAMIDRTKKYEALYLRNIKEGFSSFDNCKSLEHELNQIEETFRHPNLLIQTIQELQWQQEVSLKDIQLKLNQMAIVKDHLTATNHFKPNLSSLNQEGGALIFGSIKLNACWLNVNSFQSEIIKGEQQWSEFIKLCEFSPNDKWSLLYRGTRDGFGSNDFHSKCDGHSNTLTIVKAKESKFIFGGFSSVSWESSTNGRWKSDANAFIFSLTNKDIKPVKMKVDPNNHQYVIGCHSRYGPTFGIDLCIANNSNTTIDSVSNLGYSYNHPQYDIGTNEADTFLAGSVKFQLDEIEVYQKE